MLELEEVKNEKPQGELVTRPQGNPIKEVNGNNTTLAQGKARYEKGMALYKQGKVSIGSEGYFKVNGFTVDAERVSCDCPDYMNRKQACKHYYAACLFLKNRCKPTIEHLEGFTNGNGTSSQSQSKSKVESKYVHYKNKAGSGKGYDRQSTITRLAVLNTATEVLKTHRKPIELDEVFSLAKELESWALGC